MDYVIGIDGGSTKCLLKAKTLDGRTIATLTGETTNHSIVGKQVAQRRISRLISSLIKSFDGSMEDCRCIVVGAAGIDSPQDSLIVETFYDALQFRCSIFCMNDGIMALYAATKGVGVLAISGTGSIVVGRNAKGKVTRSGGYSITINGDEGSSRWMSVMALNHMSKWVDESVPKTPLVRKMIEHFHGFDADKLIQCSTALYRRPINPELALLVYDAAKEGDQAAVSIIKRGAEELFKVAQTVTRKLDFNKEDGFLSGMWGSVFVNNEFFTDEYRKLFTDQYPNAKMIFPSGDAADGAAAMALDYLNGSIDFIDDL
ncbi:MAG: hypothetical protein LBS72_07650 [Oscillospiraceae bacterium]|jgi:N-acetylglucosamine kinase-like BadF-type ATPase|nr:hypothetical protein [Oscillospiraceae bacterium]